MYKDSDFGFNESEGSEENKNTNRIKISSDNNSLKASTDKLKPENKKEEEKKNKMSTFSPQTYSTKMQSDPKDSIINQLKTQIFDLEQNQQNYELLQTKYKSLSNDLSILNEEKIRLEYELKQKTETTNKNYNANAYEKINFKAGGNKYQVLNKNKK